MLTKRTAAAKKVCLSLEKSLENEKMEVECTFCHVKMAYHEPAALMHSHLAEGGHSATKVRTIHYWHNNQIVSSNYQVVYFY